ncbi:MAG: swr complex subunit [Pycnora praestabilis]|nr:MAG: swr complex subunit [Pycnora praestabilis]
MTTADVRDMLDLPSDGHPRPAKKQKTVEKRPEGITRELFALLGERAPPVAISDHIKYKERPKWSHKVQPWEQTRFNNPAREDGLVLQHWRKKRGPPAAAAVAETIPGDVNGGTPTADQESKPESKVIPPIETEYYYAKFNVKVSVPEYDDAEYDLHLTNREWSKEETDYLIQICRDFDLRWVVIADRYDYQPFVKSTDVNVEATTALVHPPKRRTMEDMKARYYELSHKTMAFHRPIPSMSTAEFTLHETMSKFDPAQETKRKQLAEALLSRTADEIKEEELLLSEIRRIDANQTRLMDDRLDLYTRLEAPPSTGNTQMYQSSQGLGQLMSTLLSADKSKKRRSLLGPTESGTSPAVGSNQTFAGQKDGKEGGSGGHRDSIASITGTGNKKGSISGPSGAVSALDRRPLTADEELKYGISHHERLTSGVSFRHDRISKLSQAKSNVQATKLSAALTELQIPPRLVMPTSLVCEEYERLIRAIGVLLDVRKVSEKVEGEIRILGAQRHEREKRERAERGEPEPEPEPGMDGEGGDGAGDDVDGEVDGDVDMEGATQDGVYDDKVKHERNDDNAVSDVPRNRRASTAARSSGTGGAQKRSASVLSAVSDRSTKRQKK